MARRIAPSQTDPPRQARSRPRSTPVLNQVPGCRQAKPLLPVSTTWDDGVMHRIKHMKSTSIKMFVTLKFRANSR
jgi:hypothetical protein